SIEDVVRWGSTGGARVLGIDGLQGIAVGGCADIAVYALDDPRYFGLHDPAIGPVACGGRPHLKWLLVQGRLVVENDSLPGVDLAQLGREARTAVKDLLSA
ncbi:MAG TPA: amidohydrolase, partial [Noviherbaspirillum sp.]